MNVKYDSLICKLCVLPCSSPETLEVKKQFPPSEQWQVFSDTGGASWWWSWGARRWAVLGQSVSKPSEQFQSGSGRRTGGRCQQVCSSPTHTNFKSVLAFSQHPLSCSWGWHGGPTPCISVVLEATHEASQGLKMETRELLRGTEENSVSPPRGHRVVAL